MQRLLWIVGFMLLTAGIGLYMTFATPLEASIVERNVQATVEAYQQENAAEFNDALQHADATRAALQAELDQTLAEKEE